MIDRRILLENIHTYLGALEWEGGGSGTRDSWADRVDDVLADLRPELIATRPPHDAGTGEAPAPVEPADDPLVRAALVRDARTADVDGDREAGGAAREAIAEFDQRRREAAVAASGPVEAEPLKWHADNQSGDQVSADSVLGRYAAWTYGARNSYWCPPGYGPGVGVDGPLSAAQAGAQADFEARIRSAIVTKQEPSNG